MCALLNEICSMSSGGINPSADSSTLEKGRHSVMEDDGIRMNPDHYQTQES